MGNTITIGTHIDHGSLSFMVRIMQHVQHGCVKMGHTKFTGI